MNFLKRVPAMGRIGVTAAFLFLGFYGHAQCDSSKAYATVEVAESEMNDEPSEKKIRDYQNYPKYNGGMQSLENYLQANLKLAPGAEKQTFIVNAFFMVMCDGSIADAQLPDGFAGGDMTNIAGMLMKMPAWTPATVKGKPVNCYYLLRMECSAGKIRILDQPVGLSTN
jgi:hypothetical protein